MLRELECGFTVDTLQVDSGFEFLSVIGQTDISDRLEAPRTERDQT